MLTKTETEVELAAVEEDVERKRVGKNPFDEKFTSLTESPFAETLAPSSLSASSSSRNGGQEQMETISRHIIVRMEVIAKQIAFLSKETSGQPDRILAAVTGGSGGVSSKGRQRGDDRKVSFVARSRAFLGGPAPDTNDVDHDGGDSIATSKPSSSSFLGESLPARLDLFRQLRRGLATDRDLLPEGMLLSETSAAMPPSPPPPPPPATTMSRCGPLSATPGKDRAAIDCSTDAPAGILHGFIKHVKPFSVCFESNSAAAAAATASANHDDSNGDGEEDADGDDDDDDQDHEDEEAAATFCDYGDSSSFRETSCPPANKTSARRTNTAYASVPRDATTAPRIAATATTVRAGDLSLCRKRGDTGDGAKESSSSGSGEQKRGRQLEGAPRKPVPPPPGGSEALRRAEVRLQGKRKLAYPWPCSPSYNTSAGATTATAPTVSDADDSCCRSSTTSPRHRYSDDDGGGGDRKREGVLGSGGRAATAAASAAASAGDQRTAKDFAGAGGYGAASSDRRRNEANSTNSAFDTNEGDRGKGERRARAGTGRRQTGGKKRAVGGSGGSTGGGGGDGGGGGLGDGSEWWSLSRSSAKKLRERMEASVAPAVRSRGGGRGGGGGGGRRNGGGSIKANAKAKTITLSYDPTSASSAGRKGAGPPSGFGPLELVSLSHNGNSSGSSSSNNTSLDCPGATGTWRKGVDTDYLVSLANPLRDLAAMR
ncbi:unnamed protein product, partial [Hapterophycus canaliculatus]